MAELIELDIEYQYISTEDESKDHNYKDFYNYKYDVYEEICRSRILELFSEIKKHSSAESFQIFCKVIGSLLVHNHYLITEASRELVKFKNIVAVLNFFIESIEKASDYEEIRYFVEIISSLNVSESDFENLKLDTTIETRLVSVIQKAVRYQKLIVVNDNFWLNINLHVINFVNCFGKLFPKEIVKLDTEIMYYLDIDKFGARDFEIVMYHLKEVFNYLKSYFSLQYIQEIRNIVNKVATNHYATHDNWVVQNVLPTLKIIGENDAECQATIAILETFEIEKHKYQDDDIVDEQVYIEIITFCEHYLTQKSPKNDKDEYYHAIHQLIDAHNKYANRVLNAVGDVYQVYDLLLKATYYTEI